MPVLNFNISMHLLVRNWADIGNIILRDANRVRGNISKIKTKLLFCPK